MSINSIFEILIHFHTYKNIDLVNQGLYQIKTNISTSFNNKNYFAVPYYYSESKDLESLSQIDENEIKPHNVIINSVDEDGYSYKTKSFVIRYADEEVELDEFCYFRLEVPSKLSLNNINFICNFTLEFSDVLSGQNKDIKNGLFQSVKFKTIQSQSVIISNSNPADIYNESYSPIVYKDSFSSLLSVSIHKILVDYKIRDNELILPFNIDEKYINNIDTDKDNINKKKELLKNLNSNNNNKDNKDNKDNCCLINFFLDKNSISNFLSKNIINDLYSNYIINLVNSYISVKVKLKHLSLKLIDDTNKAENASYLNTPPLVIYSEEKDENILITEENINTLLPKLKDLSSRVSDFSKEYIGFRLLQEINFISSQINFIWHKYIELIRTFPGPSNFIMMIEFKRNLHKNLFQFLKKSIISIPDTNNLLIPIESKEHNSTQAEEIRNSLIESIIKPEIENEAFKINASTFPILFEETYIKNLSNNENSDAIANENIKTYEKKNVKVDSKFYTDSKTGNNYINLPSNSDFNYDNSLGLHLIVLVHGFQGNSNDMRLIKNEIALLNPSCVFLSSVANQDDTEIDFIEMGKKLAKEIKSYIKEWTEGLIFKKLSFIGHSIGGVIIRSALPYLEDYKSKFWLYISLSSPHMGYAFSESRLINAGMWVLKKWKGSKSLEQLMLDDNKNFKDTCLYKISEFEGLNWFNYVYFLSSHQDYYAPYESTRIQLNNKTLEKNVKAEAYRQMAYNILSKLTNNTLKRIDVNFVIQEKNLDSFIGRTAHIQFLENTDFMKIFFNSIEDLFN